MSDLKRYALNPDNGWMTESQRGAWVRYADLTGAQPAPAAPSEFWTLLHEWADSPNEERRGWIEHRFAELFALAAPAARPADSAMDTERLDWLEQHFTRVHGIYVDAGHTVRPFEVDCGEDTFADRKPHIRDAIDRARALTAASKTENK